MKNRLVALVAILTITLGTAQASQTGQVSGDVREKCGQSIPSGLRAQLVDSQGTAVPGMTTAVTPDAKFAFTNVAPGMYTAQITSLANTSLVLGMTAVTVTAGGVSNARVTVGTAQCAGWNKSTKLILGAAAIGTVAAIIATRSDASPSR